MGFGQFGQMSSLSKWVFGTNGHVGTGTMDVWGNRHLGSNGHFGTNEHWYRGVGVGGNLGLGCWGQGVAVGVLGLGVLGSGGLESGVGGSGWLGSGCWGQGG